MIVTCPSCATRYDVPETAIREAARRLRCGACAYVWAASPEEGGGVDPDFRHDGPPDDEDIGFARHLEEAERLERNLASMAQSARTDDFTADRRAGRSQLPGLLALAATLALAVGAAWEYRDHVVSWVPAAASLYELAGVRVNVRGMDFANVVVSREFENGLPVLAVRGEIVNVSDGMVEVPRVRFGLRDAARHELYHWTMAVASDSLAPDESARFTTRLAAPPGDARDVVVRFHDRDARRAAIID